MRKLLLIFGLFVAVLLLASAPQVRADGIDTFSFSESLDNVHTTTYTWQSPATAAPGAGNYFLGAGFFLSAPVFTYFDGTLQSPTPTLDTIGFFVGGSSITSIDFSTVFGLTWIDPATLLTGQVYTGPENAPTFLPGTFSGTDPLHLDVSGNAIPATLTISTPVPEPSSLLLLSSGFLALVGALALKKL